MFRRLFVERLEPRQVLAPVVPAVETANAGGAADDIAIWIHPEDVSQSRVIGAIKSGTSAMEVYRLDGTRVQILTAGDINNIDLRYNFPMAEGAITLLAGSDRSNNSLALYRIDDSGMLTNVAVRTISTGMAVYGCTMYVSPTTGKFYAFLSSESGDIQQWELFDSGSGKVDARLVRSFDVGRITEGMVADDETGYLYAAEEDVGIWRYSAEPTGGTGRIAVDSTRSTGHLRADVEGLAIYYRPNGEGYLIASSQGSNDFVIYQRSGNNPYVGRFEIVASGGIDAVSDTDGIDVTNFPLGDRFPHGMFVAQDNDVNFKLVSWNLIADATGVDIDTRWDPRKIGQVASPPPSSMGDFNDDGSVDAADFTVWRSQLGQSRPALSGADGDGDGFVGVADYQIWKAYFGMSISAKATASGSPHRISHEAALTAPVASSPVILYAHGPESSQNATVIIDVGPATSPRPNAIDVRPTIFSVAPRGPDFGSSPTPRKTVTGSTVPNPAVERAWSEWADGVEENYWPNALEHRRPFAENPLQRKAGGEHR